MPAVRCNRDEPIKKAGIQQAQRSCGSVLVVKANGFEFAWRTFIPVSVKDTRHKVERLKKVTYFARVIQAALTGCEKAIKSVGLIEQLAGNLGFDRIVELQKTARRKSDTGFG